MEKRVLARPDIRTLYKEKLIENVALIDVCFLDTTVYFSCKTLLTGTCLNTNKTKLRYKHRMYLNKKESS